MARHKKRKHSWNPYTSEIQRLSIYPRVQVPKEDDTPKTGEIIEVFISGMDDKGRGIGYFKGRKIIVRNASVGSKVRVRITHVGKDVMFGEIIKTVSESSVEY
ncbi:MAG: deoxyribonuclease [Thermoprotei archaeon]|nr:MAG: deoxyribonuclease [Thermoprotei archaeon]